MSTLTTTGGLLIRSTACRISKRPVSVVFTPALAGTKISLSGPAHAHVNMADKHRVHRLPLGVFQAKLARR